MTVRPWPAVASVPVARAVPRAAGRGVRPIAVLHVALALVVVGQLGRIPVLWSAGKDAPVLVHELALVAALGAAALACLQARTLRLDGVAAAALLFAAVGGGSALLATSTFRLDGFETAVSLAYLARWLAYFGVYVAILNTARDEDGPALWTTLERAVLAFAVFGLVQSVFIPGFAQKVFPESGSETMAWDWQGHRLVSSLLDPNYAGGLLLLPLLVQLARLAYGDRVPLWKPLVLVAAVIATFSRSTVLGLVLGCMVIVAARGLSRRMAKLGLAAMVVVAASLPAVIRLGSEYNKFEIDGSAMQRTVGWLRALTVVADHPVLGIGFNTYGFVQKAYGWDIVGRDSFAVDGGLLFIAVMTGLVGLALYLGMLGLVVRRCRRLWRDATASAEARGTALGVAAGVLAICVHSFFVNSLLYPFIMEPMWVLWGVVFLHARRVARLRRA